MNQTKQNLESTFIKYGLYSGLILVAYNFIGILMGLNNEVSWTAILVYYGVFFTSIFVIIPLGQYEYRKINGGVLSLEEAMKLGLGILLLGLILNIFSQLIIWEFITDQDSFLSSYERFIIDNFPPEMLTDEIIEESINDTKNQFSFASIGTRLLANLILIAIYTLITGLVLKKNKPA